MADAQGGQGGSGQWFLRLSEDMTYGPIPFSTLVDWTADGRILAENMVSRDSKEWVPAESVPDLKMEWTTELKNGSIYGPFSLLAAPQLVKRGIVSEGAILSSKITGKTIPINALLRTKDLANISVDDLASAGDGAGATPATTPGMIPAAQAAEPVQPKDEEVNGRRVAPTPAQGRKVVVAGEKGGDAEAGKPQLKAVPGPAAKPAMPVAKPATPVAKPATPVAKPATPVAKPAGPTAAATPVAKPAPAAAPAKPAGVPPEILAKF
ncbi:hypothetical protein ACFLQU_05490, partial [Verrucomicrobiota bacterium]